MGILRLPEVDKLEVTVLVDNYSDLLLESTGSVKRPLIPLGTALLAEHGLSCLVKVYSDSEEHWVLLDTGVSPTCFLHNVAVLEVDLTKIEAVVLSHGHFDHFGGMLALLGRARKGIPLVLHPDAFLERRERRPNQLARGMPRLDEVALRETGVVLQKSRGVSTLASDNVLVTGEVERITHFEKGFPWAEAKIDGEWVLDPFHDDQGIAVNVKGCGLVVIGGCSHAGIINTVRYAQKLAGIEELHAVMGGFHLCGPIFESVIKPTIAEMKKLSPHFVVPMHCTGWKAINQFDVEMPEQFLLNSVGATYVFQKS